MDENKPGQESSPLNVKKTDKDDTLKRRIEEVVRLLYEAKGEDRNFSAYAKASGISATAMSRLKNGIYLPTIATMKKLTSASAKPQGGITFNDFMQAAGYDEYKEYNTFMPYTPDSRMLREKEFAFKKEFQSQLYTALADKGIMFKKTDENSDPYDRQMIDISLDIINQKIKKWQFEIMYWYPEIGYSESTLIAAGLGKALLLGRSKDRKFSFVVNNERIFQILKRNDHALSFYGEMSVILFDPDKKFIVEECYLANVNEGKTEKEIYIA